MDSDEVMDDGRSKHPKEQEDLDEKFPNRPRNHSPTLPFHELFQSLFNPLSEIKKKPSGAVGPRRKVGPGGRSSANLNPFERRRDVIERFISRWRKDVGDDIYPAFRLILPDKDRDRAMYGIKEKAIGKMLVKIMKIDKNSEDGFKLLNWKLPGQAASYSMAGDFAGRCYDVISKRPMRTEVGNMTIEEVNDRLDQLSTVSKEENQQPILAEFYRRMNPEELMWLIRIILRQMKVGATERTLFNVWHPDAENLYSISSSLRRVCWELHDPNIRLDAEDKGIALMQCYQPQLAQFQMHSLDRMIGRMKPTEDDPVFWIEEKLDGERMQLHMDSDDSVPGGRIFRFWSRKAKDYTYLYGNGIYDESGALTRHLDDAFADGVNSVILDGEMITWDPEQDAPAPFGTLKTAALAEQRNPFSTGARPLFRIFDMLYLNGRDLTRYTLRDRRNALQKCIKSVHRRFEIHPYEEATGKAEIETALRKVVAEASEGLVLKNPRSPYRLNERHDDWMKVKPEYMTEFGESLDLVVIGGYYGSGHRGGALSSFLCALRADGASSQGEGRTKCYSFCKVGGGFTAADYANIRHHTDGKWTDWNPKKPPTAYIELAGGDAQHERPDVWIKPEDSVVLCVKAASVSVSEQFRIGLTLRFPRFKKLRMDKNWTNALSVQEFLDLKSNVEQEHQEKVFDVDNSRRKRTKKATKKPLVIAGYDETDADAEYAVPSGEVFKGLNFFILTDSNTRDKKTKSELEQLVKANGASFFQKDNAAPDTICIADRRTVKVAAVQKKNTNIIRPSWILDCIHQNTVDAGLPDFLLPLEPRHIFYATPEKEEEVSGNVDKFNDSYARDVTREELSEILDQMARDHEFDLPPDTNALKKLHESIQQNVDSGWDMPYGWLFKGLVFHFHRNEQNDDSHSCGRQLAINTARFAGASIAGSSSDRAITHIIVNSDTPAPEIRLIREALSTIHLEKLPYLVTVKWIEESWEQHTLLDEERFSPNMGVS